MRSDYLAVIDYHRPESNRHSGVMGGNGTLNNGILTLVKEYQYLIGLNDGIVFDKVQLVSRCNQCFGNGTIRKAKRGHIFGVEVKCPSCKGKAQGQEFVIIDLLGSANNG